jgi:predicted RNase H-like nuclease
MDISKSYAALKARLSIKDKVNEIRKEEIEMLKNRNQLYNTLVESLTEQNLYLKQQLRMETSRVEGLRMQVEITTDELIDLRDEIDNLETTIQAYKEMYEPHWAHQDAHVDGDGNRLDEVIGKVSIDQEIVGAEKKETIKEQAE